MYRDGRISIAALCASIIPFAERNGILRDARTGSMRDISKGVEELIFINGHW